jgi:DNA-binding MarR family transcriptional regulator
MAMSSEEDIWNELRRLTVDLLRGALQELEHPHYERIQVLGKPSSKLVYLFLRHHQPQSFTSIRRTLRIGGNSVLRATRELTERGFVKRDERDLFWLSDRK